MYPNAPSFFTSRAACGCHRQAIERGGEAHALHAVRSEGGDGRRLALDPGHEVEGLCKAPAHLADRLHVPEPGRHQHVGAGFLVGLQAADRIIEVGDAAHEVLGPRRQGELEGVRACGSNRGLDPGRGRARS